MSDIAIRVENLSKLYRIGKAQRRHDTLRDALADTAKSLTRRGRRTEDGRPTTGGGGPTTADGHPSSVLGQSDTIWALRDVSFEVKRGEVVGIIGRNGAGKSTLLKILSRITEPTEGRAEIHGRVGSLLEVGTGFHPELTGRENIYLNGAILGMKRAEIDRKFDEIVAFAEIEKFLDTPVKHYSSGMYVRLAFAVAAHLEPEILLVDEVLAVGDAQFQKKCLGKMGDVAKEGRTVLFVSHNMVAVQSLCRWGVWLDRGRIKHHGPTGDVVSSYLRDSLIVACEQVWDDIGRAPGNGKVRLHRVSVQPEGEKYDGLITMSTPLQIAVEFWNLVPGAKLHITLHLYTEQDVVAFTTGSCETDTSWRNRPLAVGLYRSVCHVPGNLLNSGMYRLLLLVVEDLSTVIYRQDNVLAFNVLDTESREGAWFGREPGAVHPRLRWTTWQRAADQDE